MSVVQMFEATKMSAITRLKIICNERGNHSHYCLSTSLELQVKTRFRCREENLIQHPYTNVVGIRHRRKSRPQYETHTNDLSRPPFFFVHITLSLSPGSQCVRNLVTTSGDTTPLINLPISLPACVSRRLRGALAIESHSITTLEVSGPLDSAIAASISECRARGVGPTPCYPGLMAKATTLASGFPKYDIPFAAGENFFLTECEGRSQDGGLFNSPFVVHWKIFSLHFVAAKRRLVVVFETPHDRILVSELCSLEELRNTAERAIKRMAIYQLPQIPTETKMVHGAIIVNCHTSLASFNIKAERKNYIYLLYIKPSSLGFYHAATHSKGMRPPLAISLLRCTMLTLLNVKEHINDALLNVGIASTINWANIFCVKSHLDRLGYHTTIYVSI
ncbi:uncharacterized protein BDR25DRAFT_349705 [Lindgomyces ingoldianus]|uniref:Uncharacterized protein n=1 Tax=Lindgomyces ingoldianus TaxID=673940 RepID=A0ACB6RC02_9PLEO|nr:uncharacterized protein BDR25DRAFT_349705 [Lindgomyces ingoldianus]KAF2476627.1 hypothetical protein BDR25DRAFT_349705 [Lindgomyces ingoldianus]